MNLIQKILDRHLVSGRLVPGEAIALRIEQTITQDALGMLAYMAFERMGLPRIQTELSVSYTDHNLLYTDYRNPDDHKYQMTLAKKYGVTVSRAGNGICHSVHLARFAVPGKMVVGTDSHTPSAGALGMLGIGAGGMDVAIIMAGEPLTITMPEIIEVRLFGKMRPGVNAKDAALELLRRVGVKGGVGKAFEFTGDGAACLTVPERMTLTNLAVETGATTSVFASDEMTLRYLKAQERAKDYMPLAADPDAVYDGLIEIDLSALTSMIARPHQPDNVCPVADVQGVQVDQVFIGSCTNCSYTDLTRAARVLEGRRIAEHVSLIVTPGTRQNYLMLLKNGVINTFVRAGARVLECGCGPCIGIGQAVRTGGVSVRTINRNFKGRCGTVDSQVYIAGPETAAATAIAGYITTADTLIDPTELQTICEPEYYDVDDSLIMYGGADPDFWKRALDMGSSVIVAGENYGQGSSREHAALMPMYLGVRAVIAKSFARIHRSNLINFGLLPLEFANPADYDAIRPEDALTFTVREGGDMADTITVHNRTSGSSFVVTLHISDYEKELLCAGGVLQYIKQRKEGTPQ